MRILQSSTTRRTFTQAIARGRGVIARTMTTSATRIKSLSMLTHELHDLFKIWRYASRRQWHWLGENHPAGEIGQRLDASGDLTGERTYPPSEVRPQDRDTSSGWMPRATSPVNMYVTQFGRPSEKKVPRTRVTQFGRPSHATRASTCTRAHMPC